MMGIYELHAEQQQPLGAEIYQFTVGDTIYRYTSYETDVNYNNNLFTHEAIQRSGFDRRFSNNNVSCSVKVPSDLELVNVIKNAETEIIEILLMKIFLDHNVGYYPVFKGAVDGLTIDKGVCTLECSSFKNAFSTKVPKLAIQTHCNNVFGDSVCGIDIENFEVVAEVKSTEDSGSTLLFRNWSGPAGVPDILSQLKGGFCKIGNQKRWISRYTFKSRWYGDDYIGPDYRLYLHYPFNPSPEEGATIYIYPGCDKHVDTCNDTYSNLNNFMGFPYIPENDPFSYGIVSV